MNQFPYEANRLPIPRNLLLNIVRKQIDFLIFETHGKEIGSRADGIVDRLLTND